MDNPNVSDDGLIVSCSTCEACCCRLEVILIGDDGVPSQFTTQDQWGGWVMLRLDDGRCAALDRNTMLCTIYECRPNICRDFQMGESDCIGERSMLAVEVGFPVTPNKEIKPSKDSESAVDKLIVQVAVIYRQRANSGL